jgi:type IV secretory pathway VirB10-like protein
MDAKVIAAIVVLVVGLIISTAAVASAVNDGDKAKDKMMIANYSPPPPPSPIPSPPPPPVSPSPSPPPPQNPMPSPPPPPPPPVARRMRALKSVDHNAPGATYKLSDADKYGIFASFAKKAVSHAR